jgi:hypothetical protein
MGLGRKYTIYFFVIYECLFHFRGHSNNKWHFFNQFQHFSNVSLGDMATYPPSPLPPMYDMTLQLKFEFAF